MPHSHTLENFLSARGAQYTVEHHSASMTSLDTARNACIDEASLAKSVVLEDDRGFVLAVLPASRRLELDRVCRKLGRDLHISQEYEMVRLFPDCALGAIPPLGSAYGLATVVDVSLEDRDEVFFEGGDHETLVRMDGGQFLGLLATASVAKIASESPSLTAALVLRERLYRSQSNVSRATGAPIGSGSRWRVRLERALVKLASAAEAHVVETEGPDGILAEIVQQAPRLWREIDRQKAEHDVLIDDCARVLGRLRGSDSSLLVRREVQILLGKFEAHRHRGADLVYEAFDVDIGGG
jgi:Ala-tRNA(Pro) deacylase